MRRAAFILVCFSWFAGQAAVRAQSAPAPSPGPAANGAQIVDGVAARIEDDIITESELTELAAFQQLVDGRAKSRDELIRELADQWIVRGEAATAKFPQPTKDEVDGQYAKLGELFPSAEEFRKSCAAVGLSESGVRRLLTQQIYFSRFLDYRFRPAAQVDQTQIRAYYRDEFTPQMKARGQSVPPLDDVADAIREVLVQRAINDRAKQWLDDTRARLTIDVVSQGDRP